MAAHGRRFRQALGLELGKRVKDSDLLAVGRASDEGFQVSRQIAGDEADRVVAAARKVRDQLVLGNMGLAHSLARRYCPRSHWRHIGDVVHEAALGLLHAVDLFDRLRGGPLHAFAYLWIRNKALDGIARIVPPVQVSPRAVAEYLGLEAAERRFVGAHERVPSDAEMSALLRISEGKVRALRLVGAALEEPREANAYDSGEEHERRDD